MPVAKRQQNGGSMMISAEIVNQTIIGLFKVDEEVKQKNKTVLTIVILWIRLFCMVQVPQSCTFKVKCAQQYSFSCI